MEFEEKYIGGVHSLFREDLEAAVREIARLVGERELVIIGTSALLGTYPEAPPILRSTFDIDTVVSEIPPAEVVALIREELGEGSEFEEENSFYVEILGPSMLNTTALGWKERCRTIQFSGGLSAHCLGLYDLVWTKLDRGAVKDLRFTALLHEWEKADFSIFDFESFVHAYCPPELTITKENLLTGVSKVKEELRNQEKLQRLLATSS